MTRLGIILQKLPGMKGDAAGCVVIFLSILFKFYISYIAPYSYALTGAVCSYEDGCWKRAFIANFLSVFHYFGASGKTFYQFISGLGYCSVIALLTILFLRLYFNLISHRLANPLVIAGLLGVVIIASPVIAFFFSISGFLEFYYYILALSLGLFLFRYPRISLAVNRKRGALCQLLGFSVLAIISVAIHENFIIVLLPTLIVLALFFYGQANLADFGRAIFVVALAFASVALACVIASKFQLEHSRIAIRTLSRINAISDIYPLRNDYFVGIYPESALFSPALSILFLFQEGGWMTLLLSLQSTISGLFSLLLLPFVVAPLKYVKSKLDQSCQSFMPKRAIICCSLAAFSPVLMGLLGWDFYRWGAYCLLNLLLLLSYSEFFDAVVSWVASLLSLVACRVKSLFGFSPSIRAFSCVLFFALVLGESLQFPFYFDWRPSFSLMSYLSVPRARLARNIEESKVRACLLNPEFNCPSKLSEPDGYKIEAKYLKRIPKL